MQGVYIKACERLGVRIPILALYDNPPSYVRTPDPWSAITHFPHSHGSKYRQNSLKIAQNPTNNLTNLPTTPRLESCRNAKDGVAIPEPFHRAQNTRE